MASLTDESQHHPQMLGEHEEDLSSPGPLNLSDLGPQTASPQSRPHKLEPLQHKSVGVREAKTKRKKTRKNRDSKRREQQLEGSERGSGEISELTSHSDPLLDDSTLQQMQARLDPLYHAPPPSDQNVDHDNTTAAADSSGSKSHPVKADGEEERAAQRKRRRSRRAAIGDEVDEVEGQAEKLHQKKRKRVRRESGSGGSETAQQEGQDRAREEEEVATVVDEEPPLPLPETFQGLSAPQYYPPPEEIQDEDQMEEGAERIVEGASPLSPSPPHQNTNQPANTVFVERTDGRGFDVHRKVSTSSVVPNGTRHGRIVQTEISSEQFAVHSHKFVQQVALMAHGLVAGLSLWDCVFCNVLGHLPGSHLTLLQSYHSLSLPAHSLYLLLLSLVLLSLLDRLDPAKLGKHCWQFTLHSLPGLAVLTASVLTLLALVVSLSLAAIDDRISLYPHQPSLWPDIVTSLNITSTNSTSPFLTTHTSSQDDIAYTPTDDDPTTDRLRLWLGLSVFRSICCVVGWGLLVCVSDHDRMKEYITSMMKCSGQQQSQTLNGTPNITTGDQNPTNTAQTPTTTTTTLVAAPGVHDHTPHPP